MLLDKLLQLVGLLSDRCEFFVAGATTESSLLIVYWPTGVAAATVSLGREMIRVTRGTHVYVTVSGVSS